VAWASHVYEALIEIGGLQMGRKLMSSLAWAYLMLHTLVRSVGAKENLRFD
jgi:hypothetical protein